MLGADIFLEGLGPAQELLWACVLWAQATFLQREGTGPRRGQPVTKPNSSRRSAGLFLANSIKFFVSVS